MTNGKLKILIVGDWNHAIYEKALFDAFITLGHDCEAFSYGDYFTNSLLSRVQNKFVLGPKVTKLNKDLLNKSVEKSFDIIFIYRGLHITPKTIKSLNKNCKTVFYYNNDDPFSKKGASYRNRYVLKSLNVFDWIFCYRNKNIQDLENLGLKNASLLRSYYCKDSHYKIEPSIKRDVDIAFIGHFEDDGRDLKILHLLKNLKKNIRIFGTSWENSPHFDELTSLAGEIKPLRGVLYNKMLNKSKISLVFLSKINNDSYTRRCFEIPAASSLMLSEKTEDLENLFQEDEEIVFFDNKEELLEKANNLLQNAELRNEITQNAKNRLLNDGHECQDRAQQIINQHHAIYNNN